MTHQGFPEVLSGPSKQFDPRPSLDINQINENLKFSREPQELKQENQTSLIHVQSEMNHKWANETVEKEMETLKSEGARRASLQDLTVYDLKNKKVLNKKISLKTVQKLLSQKQFVKDLMKENNEFLKIVTEEVKAQVKDEVKGRFSFRKSKNNES